MPPALGASDLQPPPEPVAFVPDPGVALPSGAEVVVVGAGVVGASVAYRLAAAGMRPLVIDANAPASGASGRNAGLALAGLGGHYPRATRLVKEGGGRSILDYTSRSLDLLDELEAALEGGIEWERSGSLDLLCDEQQEAQGRALAALQAAEGLETGVVPPPALRELVPGLDPRGIRAARWTPRDGKLNPFKLVYGLLETVGRGRGRVLCGVRVERLVARGDRVVGLDTSHGRLACDAVVLATNAWTPFLAPQLAANLTPIREHVCVTEPLPPLLSPGVETNRCSEYWRQMRSGELVIGGFASRDAGMGIGTYSTAVTPTVPPLLAQLLIARHPAAADARIVRCWAGLLDFAALEVPIAGELPAADGTPLRGAYVACGLTGHGMPYAPILGMLIAELVTTGSARTLPLAPFEPRRAVGPARAPTWLGPFEAAALLDP